MLLRSESVAFGTFGGAGDQGHIVVMAMMEPFDSQ